MKKKLIITIENSLTDFSKKGNLDLSLEYYNPNGYFDEVYFISYKSADKEINHNKEWLKIVVPSYFNFLEKIKQYKLVSLLLMPFIFFIHIINLTFIIKRNNINIARSGHPYLMSLSLLIATKLSKISLITTIGGDNRLAQEKIGRFHIFNNKYLSYAIEEYILNKCSSVIVPNIYTSNYVKKISKQRNIEIIPLPLRKELFKNLYKINNKEIKNFLFIGRFVGDKHPDFVLDLYIKFLKNNPNSKFNLIMIGNGELEKLLKDKVKEFNLEDRVIFTGFLNTEEITFYLEMNSICLIPISGFVIYEAATFGNIIVTSDIEWHSEFIEDNINGWVAKYLDIDDWLYKIEKIIENIETSKVKALKLKDKMKELTPEEIYKRQIHIYEKFINLKR